MNRVLYATRARRAIVTLLRSERRYLSAADIFERLRGEQSKTSISTVYRTLDLLEDLGTVSRRNEEDDEATFVYCGEEHHHHAICRVCGHVDDIECDVLDTIRTSLEQQRAFELDEHTLEFYGRCTRCRKQPQALR